MDHMQLRLDCLKIAIERGGGRGDIVAMAAELWEFVQYGTVVTGADLPIEVPEQ